MGIKIVSAYDRAEEVRRLFEEYTDMLIENDPSFQDTWISRITVKKWNIWRKNTVCRMEDYIWLIVMKN